jgi:capsule polysaccharide export protein KpsE/RkpR
MNESRIPTDMSEDEIDIGELLRVLWEGKYQVILGLLISAALAVSYALDLPDRYTSESLLAPRSNGGPGGALGQLTSQYAGLAGLAGISMGSGTQDQATIALEMLKSRKFFGDYLYESILVDLMASEGWDRPTNTVLINESVFDSSEGTWLGTGGPSLEAKPSLQEAHASFLGGHLSLNEDSNTGFITLKVTHYSPEVAQKWSELIIQSINEAVRSRDVNEAENSISFLQAQRLKTNLVSMTQVFSELIEEKTKTVMLAN